MDITDIYRAVIDRGLARSQRDFSTKWLGMACNYAADRGLGRCSADALARLYRRLAEARQDDLAATVLHLLVRSGATHETCEAKL